MLVHRVAPVDGADLVLRLPKAALAGLLAGSTEGMTIEGDSGVLERLAAVLQAPDPAFDIGNP